MVSEPWYQSSHPTWLSMMVPAKASGIPFGHPWPEAGVALEAFWAKAGGHRVNKHRRNQPAMSYVAFSFVFCPVPQLSPPGPPRCN